MKYKPYYPIILIIASTFYLITAMMDFSITMGAYNYYGDLFFLMEMNPAICFLLKLGIPPMHMFIIPFIVTLLSYYFLIVIAKIHAKSIIKDRIIWGIGFSTCLTVMMGVLHLLGFISWFYHGAF